MKKIKFIAALSLALIFAFGFNHLYAEPIIRNDKPAEKKATLIAYVVRIASSNYLSIAGSHYLILMTDETGRQIGTSKTFRAGVSDYTFFEPGPVRGTRIAKMIKLPLGPNSNDIPACSKTGVFYGGASYLFIISPIPVEKDNWFDIR